MLPSQESSGNQSDLRRNSRRRSSRGSANVAKTALKSYESLLDAPSPMSSRPNVRTLGAPRVLALPDGPGGGLSTGPAMELAPQSEGPRKKESLSPKCCERTMMETADTSTHPRGLQIASPGAWGRSLWGDTSLTEHTPKPFRRTMTVWSTKRTKLLECGDHTCGDRTKRGKGDVMSSVPKSCRRTRMAGAPDTSTVHKPKPSWEAMMVDTVTRNNLSSGDHTCGDRTETRRKPAKPDKPKPPKRAMMVGAQSGSVAPKRCERAMMETTARHVRTHQRGPYAGRNPRESPHPMGSGRCTTGASPSGDRLHGIKRPRTRSARQCSGGQRGRDGGHSVRHVSSSSGSDKTSFGSVTNNLEEDSHQVGAAAEGSSHQRSAGSLAPKGDWSKPRRKEKPQKGAPREETTTGSSHKRHPSGEGTPGRGGIFNRVTQRVETPTSSPAWSSGGIALTRPTPFFPTQSTESSSSATVLGTLAHTVLDDNRQMTWVSSTGVSRRPEPREMATTAPLEERGGDSRGGAGATTVNTDALIAALLDDDEVSQGESRNAPQTQMSEIPNTLAYECSLCGRAFKTKAGRTIHSKARHPVEANAEVQVERVKPRWEAEERYLLAKREVELLRAGARFINIALHNSFPGRTLESIKGQRRSAAYRELVRRLQQEATPARDAEDTVENEGNRPPPGSAPSTNSATGILDELRKLVQKPYPQVFQSERLWDIAKQACGGSDVARRLNDYIRDVFVCDKGTVGGRKGTGQKRGRLLSRRKQKQKDYAMTQNLFRKRQGDCARNVLDGTAAVEVASPDQLLAQWGEVMSPSRDEMAPLAPAGSPQEGEIPATMVNLFYPVSAQEVRGNLPPVRSAPGPDGFTARLLKTVPNATLRVIMNLLVLVQRVPTSLRGARTTFIPKKSPAKCYSDFRPITVSSVLLRLYHRILAKRILSSLDFDYRQRAFTPVDGCAENVFLLASVLEDAQQKLRPLHMASLDLSKAFDRVTTDAIIRGARRAGLNKEFLDYLRDLYEDSWTTLSLEGASLVVHPTVGVRQGDPLSPLLFNLMLDEYLQSMDPNIGYSSEQLQLDGMAFADDLLVFASTPDGLQQRLDSLHTFLVARGLTINTEKSFTISKMPSGREKRTKVVQTSAFSVAGIPLPASGVCARWKYLGVEFTPNGRHVPLTTDVAAMLGRVAKAPLKPQQRLVILRFYLIPRLYHRLVLGKWNKKLLKRLDVQIRAAVRKWLVLPQDVPLAYFHAPVNEGGLGIGCLSTAIPWMQLKRLSKMATSSSPFCRQAAETSMVKTALGNAERACVVDGRTLRDKTSVERHWSALLHASNDGCALREVRNMPAAQRWVQEGTCLLSGKAFIDVNKLRINALPVRVRTRRGRDSDKSCRGGCQAAETLDHVLQKCHRSHAARIKRHDGIVKIIADRLEKSGWTVEVGRRFPGLGQPLYPDLVARRGDLESVVIDATVISCGYPLQNAHENKVAKYNVPQVTSVVKGLRASDPLVTSATLNFRGVWCKSSAQDLLSLGLTKQDLKIITIRCLQGGIHCFRVHQRMTSML